MGWLETYRGTVHRWEVDNVDHFTVAFYFQRFQDATIALLRALGPEAAAAGTRAITECRVRYAKEMRVADVLHIRSGVLGQDNGALVLGHEIVDSASGTVTTTLEQRTTLRPDRAAAAKLAVEWTTPQDPARSGQGAAAPAASDDGFVDCALDVIRLAETGASGEAEWPAYVHRFSASNTQIIAAFGMTPAYMRDCRRGFSTFEFHLRFAAPARVGDPVRIRTGLLHVGSSSMRMLHRMTHAVTGQDIASLEQSGVHLDLDARRPAALPDEMRARARALLVASRA